jgi:hypothetical protein
VNHPKHYTQHPAGIECIDVVEHLPFNVGNAIKYLWRAGVKTPDFETDLDKASWYVAREKDRLKRLRANDSG